MKHFLLLLQFLLTVQVWAITNLPANLPCGIVVDFSYSKKTSFGSNMVWTTVLVNQTNVARTCRVTMDARALLYNGTHIGRVVPLFTTNTLAPGSTAIVEMVVKPGSYTNWTGATMCFELTSWVYVEETGNIQINTGRIVMNPSANVITTVVPTPPIQQGQSLTATVRYLNPLPTSLHNVKVSMTARGLNGTNNADAESSWDIGTVESNAWITVSTNYVAGEVGKNNISVFMTAKELNAVTKDIPVEVIAPQAILEARVTLKPEALEVSPGILTAFVRLPEGYPVSGITSATCDGAPCERMTPNEDGTEMIIKFRRQDIEKVQTQWGENLDTSFVVRGVWRDNAATRLFHGTASIKKIVGAKSK